MPKTFTKNSLSYVCTELLGLDFVLDSDDLGKDVIKRCDSYLEIMYLIGACLVCDPSRKIEGVEMWGNFKGHDGIMIHVGLEGFSHFCISPQFAVDYYKLDFAIFCMPYGRRDWILHSFCEVDGYNVHKNRRSTDMEKCNYVRKKTGRPVLRFREELTDPLEWFCLYKNMCGFCGDVYCKYECFGLESSTAVFKDKHDVDF